LKRLADKNAIISHPNAADSEMMAKISLMGAR
jgi:hypothetical protein